MSDLISRKLISDYLREQHAQVIIEKYKDGFITDDVCKGMECSIDAFVNFISQCPTVDAVPVVHASWIYGDFDKDGHWISGSKKVRCPECWRVFNSDNQNIWHWCPQCGAKMNGKKVQE